MNIRLKFLLLSIFLLILNSCDRPKCNNNNTIFDNYAPENNIYKAELEKHIKKIGADNLKYWLRGYVEKNEEEYLLVNVQNDSLCAIMQLKVNNWNKLEDIRQRKGVGRRGAELDDLKYTIVKKESRVDFIYDSLSFIID